MVSQKLNISLAPQVLSINQVKKLIVEISHQHIAILLKNELELCAFELYEIDIIKTSWQNIFVAIKNYSKILTQNFLQTQIVINNNECLIIPNDFFSKDSVEPYLASVFGNNLSVKYNAEYLNFKNKPIAAYRIQNVLDEQIKNNFLKINYTHSYSKILDNLLAKETLVLEIVKVQFYGSFMIVVVVANSTLQLIQTYNYNSAEDVVYYLLNIVQEFGLQVKNTPVEVSGFIDLKSKHYELLANLFDRLTFETLPNKGIFSDVLNVSNAHYYTPFFNLSL